MSENKDIQKILNQEKAKSPIKDKNLNQIAIIVGNSNKKFNPIFEEKRKEYYSNPKVIANITERNRLLAQDVDWLKKVDKVNKQKRQDPNHIKKHAKAVKDRSNNDTNWIRKNCRPVQTPHGVFQKVKDAAIEEHKICGGKFINVCINVRRW